MKAFATKHIIGERYDSMGEFIRVLNNRDYSPYYKDYVSSKDKNFTYCDQLLAQTGIGSTRISADKSLEIALNGTDMFDDIMRANAVSSFLVESDDLELDVKRPVNSIIGSSPNVGRFLAGQPDCMRRRVKRDYSVRRNVRIIYTLDAPQFIKVENRVVYGLILINALKVLQANGYSIEFSIGYACGNPGQGLTYLLEIPMKKFNTVLDTRKMIWPVAGASGLFHIGRNWEQKLPVGVYLYRLGVSAWNDKQQRSVMKRFFKRENTVWLNMDIIASLVSANTGSVDSDGNITAHDNDDNTSIDMKEGLRKVVDFIINEKEIDVDPKDNGDGDLMLVNRYQQQYSDVNRVVGSDDSAGTDDIWNGIKLINADIKRKSKPLSADTRIIITDTTSNDVVNANNIADMDTTGTVSTVRVPWFTIRFNSFRHWWHNLFTQAGDAFE